MLGSLDTLLGHILNNYPVCQMLTFGNSSVTCVLSCVHRHVGVASNKMLSELCPGGTMREYQYLTLGVTFGSIRAFNCLLIIA